MSIFVAAVAVSVALPADPERYEIVAAVRQLQRLAEPQLRVQPSDTPAHLDYRHHHAQRLAFLDRCTTRLFHRELRQQELSTYAFIARDALESSPVSWSTPRKALVWHFQGLILSRKLRVHYERFGQCESAPGQIHPVQLFVEVQRQSALFTLSRYTSSLLIP